VRRRLFGAIPSPSRARTSALPDGACAPAEVAVDDGDLPRSIGQHGQIDQHQSRDGSAADEADGTMAEQESKHH
jgi:hypothetical protein